MLRTQEERDKAVQTRKANGKRYQNYVAKLNAEMAEVDPKKKLPYYLDKDWLILRAADLLDLWMSKRIDGAPEPQLFIYPHEGAIILKKTLRSAQRVFKEIRELNNKSSRVPVTMKEFCDYHHLDIEDTKKQLMEYMGL